ncbi:hypothetical protein BDB01DRAFT_830637 [Pilobolus umbonatus]|nr:hypothetical protein BDB01DRAFT_830637 [Pilobolus umbonatus]
MKRKHKDDPPDRTGKKAIRSKDQIRTLHTECMSYYVSGTDLCYKEEEKDLTASGIPTTKYASSTTPKASSSLNAAAFSSSALSAVDSFSSALPVADSSSSALPANSSSSGTQPTTDSSSSALPVTSKKLQKKKDKKVALEEFKMLQRTEKPMLCPTCELTDHSRSTSRLCPYRKERKVVQHNSDEVTETFTIKSSLKSTCTSTAFMKSIDQLVEYTTRVVYVDSLFVNYVVLKLVNADENVPIIDQDFVYALFSTLSGNGSKAPKFISQYFEELEEACQVDKKTLESIEIYWLCNYSLYLCQAVQNHYPEPCCKNHERRSTRFFLESLSNKTSEFYCVGLTVSQRKAVAKYIYGQRLKDKSRWSSSVERTPKLVRVKQKMTDLWKQHQEEDCHQETLYSQPHNFIKWLYFLQKEDEKVVHITEEVTATVASKAYVYRKLKELPFVASLNRRRFNCLQEAVQSSINGDKPLIFGEKLQVIQEHMPLVSTSVSTVTSRIEDKTFCPTKHTDRRGSISKLFGDWQKSQKLKDICQGQKPMSNSLRSITSFLISPKLTLNTQDKLYRRQKVFSNVINTDCYSHHLPLKPSDLQKDIDNGCQVWAVDPGISTVFTMVDQAGRVRSLSQNEYYHLCGFNDTTHIRKAHQAKYADTHKIMTELDSLKTGDMPKFLTACRKRVQHYDAIKNFYNRGLW